jgi:hypothetical protein
MEEVRINPFPVLYSPFPIPYSSFLVSIPIFSEANHPLIRSLNARDERELAVLARENPARGKFLAAFFCRYGAITYSLAQHVAPHDLQRDYCFATAWQKMFAKLITMEAAELPIADADIWQSWTIDNIAGFFRSITIPPVGAIRYRLAQASPPLWYYLDLALEQIEPLDRLTIVLDREYGGDPTTISQQLQREAVEIPPADIPAKIATAYESLTQAIPADIRTIYWGMVAQTDLLE